MKIQQFDGGLSTRTEPQFLNTNQGVVFENIDSSSGVLKPIKMPAPSGILVKPNHTYFDYNEEWVDSDEPRDYVEYQRKLYWTDRTTPPQKYDGTSQANLGIIPPPSITNIQKTETSDVTNVKVTVTQPAAFEGQDLPAIDTSYLVFANPSGEEFTDANKQTSTGRLIRVSASGTVTVEDESVPLLSVPDKPALYTDTTVTRSVRFSDILAGALTDDADKVRSGHVFRYYGGQWRHVGSSTVLPEYLGFPEWPDVSDGYAEPNGASLEEFLAQKVVLNQPSYFVPSLQGIYQYQYTYYNSADGTESGPCVFSHEIALTNTGFARIQVVASSDPQVDKIRLYRVGGNLTTSTLVTELSNSSTWYTDTKPDSSLTGQLLLSSNALNPPAGLAFLTTAYAMLFAAEGSKLRFTPIGDPNSWPELHFLEFDLDITGIASVANGVLVFTRYETHLVTGTGPQALSKIRVSADQGCISHESIQVMGGVALWMSTDGLCTSGGSTVQVISKKTLGKLATDVVSSAVYDESYYALESNGKLLQYDFAYGGVYKTQTPGVSSLTVANDKLYGYRDGELWEFYKGANATFRYKSPRFIEGSVTEQKRYKKFTIYHEGDIIIKVIIDNNLVATHELTGTDSTEIQVPVDKLRGHFVQFEVEGTGTVHEIEYVVGRT